MLDRRGRAGEHRNGGTAVQKSAAKLSRKPSIASQARVETNDSREARRARCRGGGWLLDDRGGLGAEREAWVACPAEWGSRKRLELDALAARDRKIQLDISRVTEKSLSGLFGELPSKCVLLLEDIDVVDMAQTRQVNYYAKRRRPRQGRKVLLSTLLNMLDSVAS